MRLMINNILDISRFAPSGDNVQPWRFGVKDDALYIFNDPQKDQSLYNAKQKASFIAHGSLIENIIISSKNFGLIAIVNINEDDKSNLIAEVKFSKENIQRDDLFDFILKRETNRRAYDTTNLTIQEKELIYSEIQEMGSGNIIILDKVNEMQTVALAASINEKIVLENYNLHQFLFSHVIWSPKEQKNEGMPIETFELFGPQKLIFRLCKSWRIQKLLNTFKISDLVARENRMTYESSAAFIAFVAESDGKKDLILLGRLLQRVWLTATKLNLNMQLMAGLTLLAENLSENDNKFSFDEKNLILSAKEKIQASFGSEKNIIITARIGRGKAASKRTPRLNIDDLVLS